MHYLAPRGQRPCTHVTDHCTITLASYEAHVSRWITSWLPTQQSHSNHVTQNI